MLFLKTESFLYQAKISWGYNIFIVLYVIAYIWIEFRVYGLQSGHQKKIIISHISCIV